MHLSFSACPSPPVPPREVHCMNVRFHSWQSSGWRTRTRTHTLTDARTQLVDICIQMLLDVTLFSCWGESSSPAARHLLDLMVPSVHAARGAASGSRTHSCSNAADLNSQHDRVNREVRYNIRPAGGSQQEAAVGTTHCHCQRSLTSWCSQPGHKWTYRTFVLIFQNWVWLSCLETS